MPNTRAHRLVTGAFGIFLFAVAVAVVVVVDAELWWRGVAVAFVLAALGVDALVAAVRGTSSIVSRIGPLP